MSRRWTRTLRGSDRSRQLCVELGLRGARPSPIPWLPALSAAALALLLSACGSTPTIPPTRAELVEQVRARGVDPDRIVFPAELDNELRRWVLQSVPEFGSDDERLNFLMVGLLSDRRRGISYEGGYTGTAREVFDQRKANCLSFSQLFVAMARAAGIPAYYLRVGDIDGYEQRGDLIIVSGHITAGYGEPTHRKVLEFSLDPVLDYDYRRAEPISDLTAVALYYTNRAAELIQAEKMDAALEAADTALELDPELAIAWVNRGVGQRRMGRWEEAETSYRRALEHRPNFEPALQNLETVLRLQGRFDEAEQIAAHIRKLGTRNPFNLLRLGDDSLSRGRTADARIYYRRALHLMRESPEPYAALGLADLMRGDQDGAERWLLRAKAVSPEGHRVRALERRVREGTGLTRSEFVRLVAAAQKAEADKERVTYLGDAPKGAQPANHADPPDGPKTDRRQ
jgi:tetratricopeptide (TPR) repeat protein